MKMSYGFDPKEAKGILDLIAQRSDFPVIVHTAHDEHSQPRLWEPVMARYPKINFIMAHGGKDRYRQCAEVAMKHPNIYIDTSTLSYNRTRYTYAQVGAGKIVFASDYPYSHPAIELKKIQLLVKDKRDLGLILYKNAARLLGL
jgi:predicted TIM-barrel fold metal-dependent hydrolase